MIRIRLTRTLSQQLKWETEETEKALHEAEQRKIRETHEVDRLRAHRQYLFDRRKELDAFDGQL